MSEKRSVAKNISTKKDAVIQPCHADAPSFEHGKITWGDDTLFFRIYGGGKYSVGQDFRIYLQCVR